MYPDIYALAYHDIYAFIKQRDPSARVAPSGLVEVTPGRLQYLDKMWTAYQQRFGTTMPVDVWNMHLYILPETNTKGVANDIASVAIGTDPSLGIRESDDDPRRCADPKVYCWAEHDSMAVFQEQVVAMRTWMKQHGEQNKPLILSEYSQLYPFMDVKGDTANPTSCYLQDENGKCWTEDRVAQFMTKSLDYLESAKDPALGFPADENRLIQRWIWFSMFTSNQQIGYVSNLTNPENTALTYLGRLYQTQIASRSTYVNLAPEPVTYTIGPPATPPVP